MDGILRDRRQVGARRFTPHVRYAPTDPTSRRSGERQHTWRPDKSEGKPRRSSGAPLLHRERGLAMPARARGKPGLSGRLSVGRLPSWRRRMAVAGGKLNLCVVGGGMPAWRPRSRAVPPGHRPLTPAVPADPRAIRLPRGAPPPLHPTPTGAIARSNRACGPALHPTVSYPWRAQNVSRETFVRCQQVTPPRPSVVRADEPAPVRFGALAGSIMEDGGERCPRSTVRGSAAVRTRADCLLRQGFEGRGSPRDQEPHPRCPSC
jgi:hypothetical protein